MPYCTYHSSGQMVYKHKRVFSRRFCRLCQSVCDVIDHDLLLRKLLLYGQSNDTLRFVSSFLSNRLQLVCANNSRFDLLPLTYGLPQGSVLCPLLFSLYINDLPLFILLYLVLRFKGPVAIGMLQTGLWCLFLLLLKGCGALDFLQIGLWYSVVSVSSSS